SAARELFCVEALFAHGQTDQIDMPERDGDVDDQSMERQHQRTRKLHRTSCDLYTRGGVRSADCGASPIVGDKLHPDFTIEFSTSGMRCNHRRVESDLRTYRRQGGSRGTTGT